MEQCLDFATVVLETYYYTINNQWYPKACYATYSGDDLQYIYYNFHETGGNWYSNNGPVCAGCNTFQLIFLFFNTFSLWQLKPWEMFPMEFKKEKLPF